MELKTPENFRFAPTVFSHGWCQLPLFSYSDQAPVHLTRVQRLTDGTLVQVRMEQAETNLTHLSLTTDVALNEAQQDEVRRVVARCLNMQQDLTAFYALLKGKPGYEWVERAGAGRMLSAPTVWEDLAKTLLTTNTTWTMTKQMVGRLVMLGDAHPDGFGHAFPTAEQIAALSLEELHEHVRAGYRSAYLHELATSMADGRVDVESWYGDSIDLYKRLKSLKGFGDYAAGSMMRLMGRFDQLGLDSVCRDMFRTRFNGGAAAPDAAIQAYYKPFGEWSGLVLWMDVMCADLSDGDA